jgi:transposase
MLYLPGRGGPAMRRAPAVVLSREERERLGALVAASGAEPRVALRARIVLEASAGRENLEIAQALGTTPGTASRWRRRFLQQRIPGIERDAPRPGRPPHVPTSTIQLIVRRTAGHRPGGRPWTARSLAKSVGVSKTTVQRIWRAHHLRPQRPVEAAPPGGPAPFVDKVTDFVGLYLNPPERAMAFCVDEHGRGSALSHRERDALATYQKRSRVEEFRAFLQTIDRETPKHLDIHLLVDHRIAATSPEVQRWLVRHPRVYLHHLPAAETGPNLIDRWFAEFTQKRDPPESFPSVVRLHRAIREHLGRPEGAARPFIWAATAEEIRARAGPIRSGTNGPSRGAPRARRRPAAPGS